MLFGMSDSKKFNVFNITPEIRRQSFYVCITCAVEYVGPELGQRGLVSSKQFCVRHEHSDSRMRSFVVFVVAFIISIVVISFDIGIRIVTGRRHFFRKLFHLNTYTLRNVRHHKSQTKRYSNISFFYVTRLRLQLRTPLEFCRVLHVLLSNRNDYPENLYIQYMRIIIFTLN